MQANTLRPGLLIGLKTSILGNVTYSKVDIEPDHPVDGGGRLARWETARTVADTREHDEAVKVRSRLRSLIASVCADSAFGLLCPESNADKLDAVVADARALAERFNADAKITRLRINIIAGRIAPDDMEAARAIGGEVRDLLTTMSSGLERLDVETVRAAAKRARDVSKMLTPQMQERVGDAIKAARTAARRIAMAGETAAIEVDLEAVRRVNDTRTAFLDLDPADMMSTPAAEGRAIDFEPAAELKPAPASRTARDVE